LLLSCIGWGATAEFTHHHGAQVSFIADSAGSKTVATDNEVTRIDSNDSPDARFANGLDCLICQLHQSLSNTLLGHAPAIASGEVHAVTFNPDLTLHRADFSKSQRGRAPPTIL
jgi:hypothetical protein